jgi:hypothetical protein
MSSHTRKIYATRALVLGCLSRKRCTELTTNPRTKKNKPTNLDPFFREEPAYIVAPM